MVWSMARGLLPPEKAEARPDRSGSPVPPPPAMLQTIGTLFQEYNRSDDEKAALLRALQPFLRPERWAKVEKAIQITRLSRVIRAAMQLFREKGYV